LRAALHRNFALPLFLYWSFMGSVDTYLWTPSTLVLQSIGGNGDGGEIVGVNNYTLCDVGAFLRSGRNLN
jgi:hypothetical protein